MSALGNAPITPHIHTRLRCLNSRPCPWPYLFLLLPCSYLVIITTYPFEHSYCVSTLVLGSTHVNIPYNLGWELLFQSTYLWGFNKSVCSEAHGNTLPCLISIHALFISWESQRTKKLIGPWVKLKWTEGFHPAGELWLTNIKPFTNVWAIQVLVHPLDLSPTQAQDTYKFTWRIMEAMVRKPKMSEWEILWRGPHFLWS